MNFIASLLFLGAAIALLSRQWMLDALIEGIHEIADYFRGGPPTPMHPSPAHDGNLLRRRSRKIES